MSLPNEIILNNDLGESNSTPFSLESQTVKIVAIDKWGNKSTKVVKVTIDIKEETVVQKLEPLNPGRAKGKNFQTPSSLSERTLNNLKAANPKLPHSGVSGRDVG